VYRQHRSEPNFSGGFAIMQGMLIDPTMSVMHGDPIRASSVVHAASEEE
jgi:hypothetical protein